MEGSFISSVCSIDKLSFPPFFRSSASWFSSQYLPLFCQIIKHCVLLLPILPNPFTLVICPSMESRKRQFHLKTWLIQLAFRCRVLFVCPLLSYTFKKVFISYFRLPYLFHSTVASHFEAHQILQLQFSKCPGPWAIQYNTLNITPNQFLVEFNV